QGTRVLRVGRDSRPAGDAPVSRAARLGCACRGAAALAVLPRGRRHAPALVGPIGPRACRRRTRARRNSYCRRRSRGARGGASHAGPLAGLVDRLPPVEVLDGIIDDTAYLYEIAGPREQQARENIKKFRGMIRRI